MGAKRGAEIVNLPPPRMRGEMSLEEAIARRRSVRAYSGDELAAEELGQLLWAAQGITEERQGFRAAPSAGALYPLELYVVQRSGVFRYLPAEHALEKLSPTDLRQGLCAAALGQQFVAQAPVDIVIAADISRTAAKYGQRAQRYVLMEVGHAAQNIHLQAVALGLDSVAVGAFYDERCADILPLLPGHDPLYIIAVGRAAPH